MVDDGFGAVQEGVRGPDANGVQPEQVAQGLDSGRRHTDAVGPFEGYDDSRVCHHRDCLRLVRQHGVRSGGVD